MLRRVESVLPGFKPSFGLLRAEPKAYRGVITRAFEKLRARHPHIPSFWRRQAWRWVKEHLKGASGKVASWQEVLDAVNQDTSAGLPWLGTKGDVLASFSARGVSFFDWLDRIAAATTPWNAGFTVFVKEELRKVLEDGTTKDPHAIYAQEFVSYMLCKRVSMFFDKSLYAQGSLVEGGFAPGMSMQGGAWHRLAMRLKLQDPNRYCMASDFNQFNSMKGEEIAQEILQYRASISDRDWTFQEWHQGWLCYYSSLIDRYTGEVTDLDGGQKSGDARTTCDNTIHSLVVAVAGLMCAYNRVTGAYLRYAQVFGDDPDFPLCVYGDDFIATSESGYKVVLDEISKVWDEWGYRHEAVFSGPDETNFLSHKFKRHGGYFVPEPKRWEKHLTSLVYGAMAPTTVVTGNRVAAFVVLNAANVDAYHVFVKVARGWFNDQPVAYRESKPGLATKGVIYAAREEVISRFYAPLGNEASSTLAQCCVAGVQKELASLTRAEILVF